MGTVRLILGDQLDLGIASLADIDPVSNAGDHRRQAARPGRKRGM